MNRSFFRELRPVWKEVPKPWFWESLHQHRYSDSRERWIHELLDLALPLWGVPWSSRSAFEELQPLYALLEGLDPHYCREDQVHAGVQRCRSLSLEQQEHWVQWGLRLMRFLRKTQLHPGKMQHPEALEEWWKLFPEEACWQAAEWLSDHGCPLPCLAAGMTAWSRYSHGKVPERFHVREWIDACKGATEAGWESAKAADSGAALWAGLWNAHGANGPCGPRPECDTCQLRTGCQWLKVRASQAPSHRLEDRSDAELMGAVLQSGSSETKMLSDLTKTHVLKDLLSSEEVQRNFGVQQALAERLHALREICKRYGTRPLRVGEGFRSSKDIYQHFQQRLRDKKQEQFIVVLLDNKHRFLEERIVTQGLLNRSLVHPREVFAGALERRAAALVCLHNHPSGDPQPSPEDHQITSRLVEAGKLLGIQVLDHLIVGDGSYVSFADKGWL